MSIGYKGKPGAPVRLKPGLVPGRRVATEYRDEVNINTIFKRLKGRGISIEEMRARVGTFVDFEKGPVKDFTLHGVTLMEAHNLVEEAYDAFEALPLEFRKELDHNPMLLASAPRELYEKYGLVKKRDVEGGNPPEAPASGQGSGDRVPGKAPKEPKNKESSEKDDT